MRENPNTNELKYEGPGRHFADDSKSLIPYMPEANSAESPGPQSSSANDEKPSYGIRRQLLTGFLIFTVVIVILLWVLQILLLDPFYEMIKTREIKTTAAELIDSMETEGFLEVYSSTIRKNIDVRITDPYGVDIVYTNYSDRHSYYIQTQTERQLFAIYQKYSQKKGLFTETYENTEKNGFSDIKKGIILITTVSKEDGGSYLLLMETEIAPVNATVDTLKVQLICITLVMIVMGVLLAVYISRRLAEPLVSINENAKRLAEGDYDIHFEATGGKEVEELAQTLNYAAVELSKVESLRRELLANVSHDLRTPLTMIRGYGEVVRDLPGENNPENIQIIIDETSRLTDLVNDLLDLSNLESGSVTAVNRRFNLTKSIREIIKRYDKLVDYHFSFSNDRDVFVVADELKISQVIYNLINNAINYSKDDKRIEISQTVSGDNVKISISDHGIGIPADKLKDIWDRYYKVDKQHTRAQIGTGIGLSIVKRILDMHSGSYGVISNEGQGSTFWFELGPCDSGDDVSSDEDAASEPGEGMKD